MFTTRIPAEVAEALRSYADDHDLAYSDVIANAVAERFGFPAVATPPSTVEQKLIA